jgi:hypothetical protein
MEDSRFDAVVKGLATRPSRRQLLRLVAGSLLGGRVAAPAARPAAADCMLCTPGCGPPPYSCEYGPSRLCIDCGETPCCAGGASGACCCSGSCCADADCPGGTCAANGACACPPTRTFCGTPGHGYCADLDFDADNCGGCGKSCPLNGECANGVCVCPTTAPTVCEAHGLPICVDVTTGYGGHFCGGCEAVDCLETQTCCAGQCVGSDVHHCGAACTECRQTPGTRPGCCDGACVDLANDKANCGRCGRACPPGQHCGQGTCQGRTGPPCRGGVCGPGCVCPPGRTCVNGRCTLPR